MDHLLPYYERELAALQGGARAFADRYPRIAAGLRISDEGSGDPHIERLIQSVAYLTARVAKRLDDDYAGFAEKLLDAIYPHYRRPLPACAIARFDAGTSRGRWEARTLVRAGAVVTNSYRFETVYPVDTGAPDIVSAAFHPAGTFRARGDTWHTGPYLSVTWRGTCAHGFRIFADGDPSVAAALRDALGLGVTAVLVPDAHAGDCFIDGGSVSPVGLDDDACLLEDPATTHPGFRLLREFFAFPDKFGFFDVCLPTTDHGDEGRVILMLDPGVIGDGRALAGVTASHLLTRCTPVVNLFRDSAGFTGKQHTDSTVRVNPTKGLQDGAELVAIDAVMAKLDGDRQPPTALPHFFAIRQRTAAADGPFWVAMEDDEDEGGENIMFLNRSFEATKPGYGFSVSMRCCDGDRPAQIVCGTPMAELVPSPESVTPGGRLITRPTALSRFPLGKQASWRLISHLALSQASLVDRGGGVLRQLLQLYAPAGSLLGEQVIRALVDVRQRAVSHWLPGAFPPTLARGTEIELAIDVTQLIGIGLHGLVRVLDVFFSLYAQINSFTQLVISSSHTGKELHRCALRTGSGALV